MHTMIDMYSALSGRMGSFWTGGNNQKRWCEDSRSVCWPYLKHITFSPKFNKIPTVQTFIAQFDVYIPGDHIKVYALPLHPIASTSGFYIRVQARGNTDLKSVTVGWIACE